MTNNHAAGSDSKHGVGIWYLFPDEPVGPSKNLDPPLFGYREAKYTKITLFDNNVAHSNGNLGLAVFRRLREDHGIQGCSTYDPRMNPLEPNNSPLNPAEFNYFTGWDINMTWISKRQENLG